VHGSELTIFPVILPLYTSFQNEYHHEDVLHEGILKCKECSVSLKPYLACVATVNALPALQCHSEVKSVSGPTRSVGDPVG
jgi:hypothetical protein